MIDFEKGIIDFGVIKIDASTTRAELDLLSCDVVEKQVSKRGSALYIFKTPFVADGVSMRASVFFMRDEQLKKSIELRPYGTKGYQQTFNASHKWIEAELNTRVKATNEVILLKSDKMEVYSAVIYSPRDGFETGGSIEIRFTERKVD